MKYTKLTRSTTVNHRNGDVDTVAEGKPSDDALYEFEQKLNIHVSDTKIVPFHATDNVVTTQTASVDMRADSFCEKDCDSMGEPAIIGSMSEITVTAGEEFDPLEGVIAKDDNGETIADIEVTVEGE